MATVLVTGVGGACGSSMVESLKTTTSHTVIGVDMDPYAAGIQLADGGQSVPAATDPTWADAMATVVDEFDVDVVVPTVDEELKERDSLSAALGSVPTVAPTQTVIEMAMDKYQTYQQLREAGHSVPNTWLATDAADIPAAEFPLIIKPRQGRGSRGIQRVETKKALATAIEQSSYAREELLCQAFVSGTEYTTSVVGTTTNRLLGIVPKEAVQKDGSTVIGATRTEPIVTRSCREIFETLNPAGPINVQQIVAEDGTPYTIEINPRFSSTSCLTVAAGVDEFDLLIRDALGESVAAPNGYESDRYILRYDGHLFADADELPRMDEIAMVQ